MNDSLEGDERERQRPASVSAEIAAEQVAVDLAYERLVVMRRSALDVVRHHHDLSRTSGGQARVEWESLLALTDQRLQHLELGGASLCFGRLDHETSESFQVGRLSILDGAGDPLVVDWRAPAAEPFYRATGRNPMGLVRRRHLLTKGQTVVGLDDEVFDLQRAAEDHLEVVGEGALLSALERSRTGRMGDIVATIQTEQDLVIRAPIPGIIIVQGGPGTGKTAVALHRAAYLLYTNRERLENAGVLVVGPNRTFLRYIEQVLPSLGETGVELTTVDGLYGKTRAKGTETALAARTKGDARMAQVIARAVRNRQRPLAGDLVVPYGTRRIRLPRSELVRLIDQGQSRKSTHNQRRHDIVRRLKRALWRQYKRVVEQRLAHLPLQMTLDVGDDEDPPDVTHAATLTMEREQEQFMSSIGRVAEFRAALERMWPLLTPEQLLHDLYGAPGLLRLACAGVLDDTERASLARTRSPSPAEAAWTPADLALLDEAATLLGPIPSRRRRRGAGRVRDDARWMIEDTVDDITLQTGELDATMRRQLIDRLTYREQLALAAEEDDDGSPAAFGHLIVDEAQDLSPMQWRMVGRRCPVGSMTIVGDLGQASRPGAVRSWQDALAQLPVRREPRMSELTINYRTPAEIMELAAGVLARTDPGLEPPRSVRRSGVDPHFTIVPPDRLTSEVTGQVLRLRSELDEGKIAIIAPRHAIGELRSALAESNEVQVSSGVGSLDAPVGLYTATEAKGLEFDAVVLVEPSDIAGESIAGLRGLYVALTRATRFLAIVHAQELPEPLRHAR